MTLLEIVIGIAAATINGLIVWSATIGWANGRLPTLMKIKKERKSVIVWAVGMTVFMVLMTGLNLYCVRGDYAYLHIALVVLTPMMFVALLDFGKYGFALKPTPLFNKGLTK